MVGRGRTYSSVGATLASAAHGLAGSSCSHLPPDRGLILITRSVSDPMHGTARAAQPQPPITPLHQAAACRPPPYPCRPVAVLAAGRSVDRRPEFPGPELAGRTAQYSADHACYLSTHLLRASCECGGRPPGPQGWMGSGASASERFSSWLLANRQPGTAPMHACSHCINHPHPHACVI